MESWYKKKEKYVTITWGQVNSGSVFCFSRCWGRTFLCLWESAFLSSVAKFLIFWASATGAASWTWPISALFVVFALALCGSLAVVCLGLYCRGEPRELTTNPVLLSSSRPQPPHPYGVSGWKAGPRLLVTESTDTLPATQPTQSMQRITNCKD